MNTPEHAAVAADAPPASLADLSAALVGARAAVRDAEATCLDIEARIVALTGKRDEGAKTVRAGCYKLVVTGKLTRKMDWLAWDRIKGEIDPLLHPIKVKRELDEKGVRYLQANEPEIYARLPIEVKPAKTSVEVTIVAEGTQ